jgi:hypothetical protein
MHVKHKDISEMSDDEKSFYYFKIHDTDNNNNLDGLEMIKAALHRHGESNSQDELLHITSKSIFLLSDPNEIIFQGSISIAMNYL